MLLLLFSLVALAMGGTILYWLFYGIITLVFQPSQHSYQKLIRLSAQLLVAVILYVVSVFLINSFLATTQLYHLQFSFSQIARTVGDWLSFSRF
ncbi:MAG: hypothetical protein LBU27_00210 [Candidatus Peribacteria bacterium]|nr:hypothetical protein [Candidatus Peribacteria bacterium]